MTDTKDKIDCHGSDHKLTYGEVVWDDPEPVVRPDGHEGIPYRTCTYCGSIHPDDLIKVLAEGATMSGSDWKYGWPHKFYVDNIPNQRFDPNIKVVTSSTIANGKETKQYGPMRKFWGSKWYNVHLEDLDEVKFKLLTELLEKHTNIVFSRDANGIKYKAPSHGYQRY